MFFFLRSQKHFPEHILCHFIFTIQPAVVPSNPLEEQWQSSINIFGLASQNLATEQCSCAKTPQHREHIHKGQSVSNKKQGIARVSLTPVHPEKESHNEKHRWCCYINKPSTFSPNNQCLLHFSLKKVVNPAKNT